MVTGVVPSPAFIFSQLIISLRHLKYIYISLLLSNEPWSQVSSLLAPSTCLGFCSAEGSVFPTLMVFDRIMLTHALALFRESVFAPGKSPESTHMRLGGGGEPTKLALVVTRLTH